MTPEAYEWRERMDRMVAAMWVPPGVGKDIDKYADQIVENAERTIDLIDMRAEDRFRDWKGRALKGQMRRCAHGGGDYYVNATEPSEVAILGDGDKEEMWHEREEIEKDEIVEEPRP